MKSTWLVILAWLSMACSPGPTEAEDGAPQTDAAHEATADTPADVPLAPTCGDGACTFGEFCAVCPADCDCTTLAATPPMGWNTWNHFACAIDEGLIRETAELMVSTGLRDAGYRYVNLDDCWQIDRDAEGRIVVDPVAFPSGLKALADYVHGLGLKLGNYTCAGTLTCQERPGSRDHELIDLQTYAEWGIDYTKVDWCFSDGLDPREAYGRFHAALLTLDRPMVLSICNWGVDEPWVWGPATGHLWRTSGDIAAVWPSMLVNLESTADRAAHAGPGHWNDPDMLEVGRFGMSPDEQRTHLGLWAITASPLIAGNDLREMTDETRAILTNRDAIAVNQDPLGLQGVRVAVSGKREAWAKPLAGPGLRAVLLANRDQVARTVSVTWEQAGLAPGPARVRDVWTGEDLGAVEGGLALDLAAHASAFYLVTGTEPPPLPGTSDLSDWTPVFAANGLGPIEKDRANGGRAVGDGPPLTLGGVVHPKGLGVAAGSRVLLRTAGRCTGLEAAVGLDDTAGDEGSVVFSVWGDGRELASTGVVRKGEAPVSLAVSIRDVQQLDLRVGEAGDLTLGDLADWANARLVCE
jgi:alpha-galactosidase